MSTRATYRFRSSQATVTFYIHYDGYPEGAARYFSSALALGNNMGLAEAFIRANTFAEFTSGHDAHGDTDYRYDVWIPSLSKTPILGVSRRNPVTDKWEIVWGGGLQDFITAFSEA